VLYVWHVYVWVWKNKVECIVCMRIRDKENSETIDGWNA